MTLNEFLEYVKTRQPLDTPEIYRLMDEMSEEARRITFSLNSAYHNQEEINSLLCELFGRPVGKGFKMFPPFYTDFGKNTHIGDDVFINACCNFQDHGGVFIGDRCQIGHNVVFATLNHGLRPEERRTMTPEQAVAAGSDFLVVGRPITKAADPAEAARAILISMGNTLSEGRV